MAAVGARCALPDIGGLTLAVKADAFLVRTTSDAVTAAASGNFAADQAGANRLRTALEGSRALQCAGWSLTPSVEIGIRQDGGDAETGLGLETGFGVVFSDPGLGLMIDATLSMLVAHQDNRYDVPAPAGSKHGAAITEHPMPTRASETDVARKIRDMAALLQPPSRWTRGARARRLDGWRVPATAYNAACWSLAGAAEQVCGDDYLLLKAVIERLDGLIPPRNYRTGLASRLEVFNDSSKHEEIIGLLEHAESYTARRLVRTAPHARGSTGF